AVSEPSFDVSATPYLVTDATKAARQLAPVLGKPEDTLLKAMARRDTGFAYLARGVSAAAADQAKKLNIAGLDFTPQYKRVYPRDWTAAQLLGSVGTDGNGLGGLEYSLNTKLRGENGQRPLVKDARGET